MSQKKKTIDQVNVTYQNGFMAGRVVFMDDTDGYEQPVPGCHIRIRVSDITCYTLGAPYCIRVDVRGEEEFYDVWGTIEAMDEVIARERLGGLVSAPPVTVDGGKMTGGRADRDPGAHLKVVPWVDPDNPKESA